MKHKHFLPRNFFAYLTVVATLRMAWGISMSEWLHEPSNEAVGFVLGSTVNMRECLGDAAELLGCEPSDETYDAIDDMVNDLLACHMRIYSPDASPDPAMAALLAAPTNVAH